MVKSELTALYAAIAIDFGDQEQSRRPGAKPGRLVPI
jgi:hypothetical protein